MLTPFKPLMQKLFFSMFIMSAIFFTACESGEDNDTEGETETMQSMPDNMHDTMMMDTSMMDTASTRPVKSPTK